MKSPNFALRLCAFGLCILTLGAATSATAQLVVFDGSHYPGGVAMYDNLKSQLTTWGYTVERRTTPLMDNTDADVIVILPEDSFTFYGEAYTSAEAAWLKNFVDGGGGLIVSICVNNGYLSCLAEPMDLFGIAENDEDSPWYPVVYDPTAAHPLFNNVSQMGDNVGQGTCLTVTHTCSVIAGDGTHDMIAVYEPAGPDAGAAIWTAHQNLFENFGYDDYDNLVFLQNAFAWLTDSLVPNAPETWSGVKALYR